MKLPVVKLHGAAILHAAVKCLEVPVTLDGLGNHRRGDCQRNKYQGHEKHRRQQDVALFLLANRGAPGENFDVRRTNWMG